MVNRLQVFLYGRPGHPRNAFELALAAARKTTERLGARVRIVSAGADWDPRTYGVEGLVENLGLLTVGETARVYRQSDVGLVMMFTRHPSYIPLELMASGCAVVTNNNPSTRWFFRPGENCASAEPSPSCLAEAIIGLLENPERRGTIGARALADVRKSFSDWDAEFDHVYEFMRDPSKART